MSERIIKVNLGTDQFSLGFWLFMIVMIFAADMTDKKPGTMGKAIGCRIGGPAFCPPAPKP